MLANLKHFSFPIALYIAGIEPIEYMERYYVRSSALQSVGYDANKKVLEVKFRDNGGVWQYFSFSPSAFKRFIKAQSLGNYFVTKIKGKYPEMKVAY